MGRRLISIILLIIFLSSPLLAADDIKLPEYEPYTKEEFPIWSMKLRRAESLFFGSMVLTLPLSVAGYSLMENYGVISGPDDDISKLMQQAAIACSVSAFIALLDYIIGEVRGE